MERPPLQTNKQQLLRGCIIQMSVGGVAKWDILHEIVRTRILSLPGPLGKLHHTLEAEMPITRSLLNEFFNKLMRSERRQEIAKAKLKKVRQQLNAPASTAQAGGGTIPTPPVKPTPAPAGTPTTTPPPANVPRKAQVGRPARVTKPRAPLQAPAPGPKKPPPPKPPVTRSQTKKQVTAKTVAVADPEGMLQPRWMLNMRQ